MTSEEIKKTAAVDLSTNAWLREMCLQLAELKAAINEKMSNQRGNYGQNGPRSNR